MRGSARIQLSARSELARRAVFDHRIDSPVTYCLSASEDFRTAGIGRSAIRPTSATGFLTGRYRIILPAARLRFVGAKIEFGR
jgi:hypothetical protein